MSEGEPKKAEAEASRQAADESENRCGIHCLDRGDAGDLSKSGTGWRPHIEE